MTISKRHTYEKVVWISKQDNSNHADTYIVVGIDTKNMVPGKRHVRNTFLFRISISQQASAKTRRGSTGPNIKRCIYGRHVAIGGGRRRSLRVDVLDYCSGETKTWEIRVASWIVLRLSWVVSIGSSSWSLESIYETPGRGSGRWPRCWGRK